MNKVALATHITGVRGITGVTRLKKCFSWFWLVVNNEAQLHG